MRKQKYSPPSLLLLLVLVLTVTSCRSQRDSSASSPGPTDQFSSTPPFQTREPERYQAKRTTTIIAPNGSATVRTNLIARDGEMRRDEEQRVVYLDLPNGKYVLVPDEKIYGEMSEAATAEQSVESSPDRVLHTEPIRTSYQKLDDETINGRNVTRYRVVVNGSASGDVTNTETFVWVDPGLGIPIKSESTSSDGTKSTMELTDISTAPDRNQFKIPEGYRKIDAKELRRRLK
jgi:outer membrane lipoprotein-sorting protein